MKTASAREKYRAPINKAHRENAIGRYRRYAGLIERSRYGTPKVQNNTVIRDSADGGIIYRFHATDLATLYPDGSMLLHRHSWDSVTTRQRVNGLLSGENAGEYHRFGGIPLACAPDKPTNPLEHVAIPDFLAWRGPWTTGSAGGYGNPMPRPEDAAHLPCWTRQQILDWAESEKKNIPDDGVYHFHYVNYRDAPCCNASDWPSYSSRWGTNTPCDGCKAEAMQRAWDNAKAVSDRLQALYPAFDDWKLARKEWLRANRQTKKEIEAWEQAYVRHSNDGGMYYPGVGFVGRPYDHAKATRRLYKAKLNRAIEGMECYV